MAPESIIRVLDAYGKVQPNLLLHEKGYPTATVLGDKVAHSDHLTVRSGEPFHLSAAGTTDPDGDSMSYLWFQYPEAGTYNAGGGQCGDDIFHSEGHR